MKKIIIRCLPFARLWRDQRGSAPVQFSIWSLLLGGWLAFSTAIFIAWDNRADSSKAAYAISDMISRQADIRDNFLTQMYDLNESLVNNFTGDVKLRVSSIEFAEDPADPESFILQTQWSCKIGGASDDPFAELSNDTIDAAIIPEMPAGDAIILTETFVPYTAISTQVVPTSFEWQNRIVTQPRRPIAFLPLCASTLGEPDLTCTINPDFLDDNVFVTDC